MTVKRTSFNKSIYYYRHRGEIVDNFYEIHKKQMILRRLAAGFSNDAQAAPGYKNSLN